MLLDCCLYFRCSVAKSSFLVGFHLLDIPLQNSRVLMTPVTAILVCGGAVAVLPTRVSCYTLHQMQVPALGVKANKRLRRSGTPRSCV